MDYTPVSSKKVLISELSQRSGLSIDTIRFYEKKGLLDRQLVRRHHNNYRDYSIACVERLMLIQQAKKLGFTLTEIQEWMSDFESDRLSQSEKQRILGQKLDRIDRRIEELNQMKSYLAIKLENLLPTRDPPN